MTRDALRLNTALTPLLVVVVAAAALAVGRQHFARLDLTADGDFSLEPVTRRILRDLDQDLVIRVYFTGDLEPPYHKVEPVVRDLVDEYRAINPARVRVEWVDPTDDPDLEAEARRMGIEEATQQVQREGRREVRRVWMGVALLTRDRSAAIPLIRRLDDLEFQLTRAIRELVEQRQRAVIGLTAGHDELDLMGDSPGLASIRETIGESYELRRVSLRSGEGVPDDVDILVVLGARQPFSAEDLVAVDQFLMSGRPAAFFRTVLRPDPATRQMDASSDNLGELLAHYGIAMDTAVIADRFSNGLMPVPVRQGRRMATGYVNHPLVPLVTDVDRGELITRGIEALPMPLSSPLTVLDDRPGCPDCRAFELAFTGPESVAIRDARSMDPADYVQPRPGERPGPFLVIAALEGSLRSHVAGATDAGIDLADRSPEGTRLLVVSSADYALQNLGFFLHAMDWLSLDADLLALRPDLSLPPVLAPLGRGETHAVRLAGVAAMPALVALVAAVRAARRRRR